MDARCSYVTGRSWRDELHAAEYHVWAFDFHGFGRLCEPYPEMDEPAEDAPGLCRAEDASRQFEAAMRFISSRHTHLMHLEASR